MAALTTSFSVAYSPFNAEALAVLEGLKLAHRLNISSIVVESDCKAVIDMLLGVSSTLTEAGVWIHDILELAGCFSDISFSHVCRGNNELAHCLAKKSLSLGSYLWLSNFPVWLTRMIGAEAQVVLSSPSGLC